MIQIQIIPEDYFLQRSINSILRRRGKNSDCTFIGKEKEDESDGIILIIALFVQTPGYQQGPINYYQPPNAMIGMNKGGFAQPMQNIHNGTAGHVQFIYLVFFGEEDFLSNNYFDASIRMFGILVIE